MKQSEAANKEEYFFTQCVLNLWSSLAKDVVEVKIRNRFKNNETD